MAPPPEGLLKAGRGQRGACVSGSAVLAGRACDTVAAAGIQTSEEELAAKLQQAAHS